MLELVFVMGFARYSPFGFAQYALLGGSIRIFEVLNRLITSFVRSVCVVFCALYVHCIGAHCFLACNFCTHRFFGGNGIVSFACNSNFSGIAAWIRSHRHCSLDSITAALLCGFQVCFCRIWHILPCL